MRPTRVSDVRVMAAKAAAEEKAERMIGDAGAGLDPIQHLVKAVHRAARLVAVWGEMVAALDASAPKDRMRGELGYHEDVVRGEMITISNEPLLALDKDGAARLHPFVIQYDRALERWAKIAKMAVDANVSERLSRIDEETAQQVADVVKGAMTELGVDIGVDTAAIVRRHLSLVDSLASGA